MNSDISREDLQSKYEELLEQAESIKKVLDMFPPLPKVRRQIVEPTGLFYTPKNQPHKGKREVDEKFMPAVREILKRNGQPMATDDIFDALVTMNYHFRTSEQPRKGAGIALGNAFRKGYVKRDRYGKEWVYKLP